MENKNSEEKRGLFQRIASSKLAKKLAFVAGMAGFFGGAAAVKEHKDNTAANKEWHAQFDNIADSVSADAKNGVFFAADTLTAKQKSDYKNKVNALIKEYEIKDPKADKDLAEQIGDRDIERTFKYHGGTWYQLDDGSYLADWRSAMLDKFAKKLNSDIDRGISREVSLNDTAKADMTTPFSRDFAAKRVFDIDNKISDIKEVLSQRGFVALPQEAAVGTYHASTEYDKDGEPVFTHATWLGKADEYLGMTYCPDIKTFMNQYESDSKMAEKLAHLENEALKPYTKTEQYTVTDEEGHQETETRTATYMGVPAGKRMKDYLIKLHKEKAEQAVAARKHNAETKTYKAGKDPDAFVTGEYKKINVLTAHTKDGRGE